MTQEVLRIADAIITSNSTTISVLIIWLFSLHTLKYYVIGTYPCSVLLYHQHFPHTIENSSKA